ncbi:MAG: metal-dependent transcriptional regulator [Candidatus Hermodarchaeota archaeon]
MWKVHESYENYLKAIYLISKTNKGGWVSNSGISDFLQVKPPSVTNMLYKLKAEELIDWKPRKSLRLTKKGKKIAQDIFRSYKNLCDFFRNVLKLENNNLVKKLSCEIEHHLTPEVSHALKELLLEY